MDVDTYIAIHEPEWKRLAHATARGRRGLANLSGVEIEDVLRLYQRAAANLAEVRTRYHDPRLTQYLNGIVARAHGAIYSVRPRTIGGFVRLFGSRYRDALRRARPCVIVAAAVLFGVAALTQLWVAGSREAQAGLLPPVAQEALRRAAGEPAFDLPSATVSTFILVNNVQVAFLAFALGVGLGIGTLYVLVQNAVLLGALAGAYQSVGRSGDFWSLVLPHGLLELTAISIAAGAGLWMGWSLIDPGDRRRAEALAVASRDAVTVLVGVIPAFVVAAFIEGFITPSPVPGPVKIGLGAAVAAAYVLFLFAPRGAARAGRTP